MSVVPWFRWADIPDLESAFRGMTHPEMESHKRVMREADDYDHWTTHCDPYNCKRCARLMRLEPEVAAYWEQNNGI